MSYFSKFPQISYPIGTESVLMRNIFRNTKFVELFKDETALFYSYTVKDQEKPEHIADRLYGDVNLHWIVLLFNDIIDPYFEWPMSDLDLESHISKMYPGQALYIDNVLYKENGIQTWKKSEVSFGVGCVVTQGDTETTILTWDANFRCLTVSSDVQFINKQNIQITDLNGNIVVVKVKRIVYDASYALHHFENPEGVILDSNLNPETGVLNGNRINAYINDSNDNDTIVKREYEYSVNDAKRKIRLLKPEYIDFVISEFTKVIAR